MRFLFPAVGAVAVTNFGDYPWVGIVLYREAAVCSCVLFHRHALAPASCLGGPRAAYAVLENGRRTAVSHYQVHPAYSEATFAHDVAVLALQEPALPRARLYFAREHFPEIDMVSVGWAQHNASVALLPSTVKHAPPPSCRRAYPDLAAGQSCARFAKPTSAACFASNGAPVFQVVPPYIHLLGIASWGPVCGKKLLPLIYTPSDHVVGFLYEAASADHNSPDPS